MKTDLRNFFIPYEGNTYAPHSLQSVAVLGMTVMVLLSFTLTSLQSLLWISSEWLVSTILPAVVIEETNEERVGGQLTTLQRNPILDAAATLKAEHMAQNQYFSHYSPDGVSPWYWFNQVSYDFAHAGENLAIHFTDSEEVVTAWMNSPTHRANILNTDFREIGVGAVEGTYEGYDTVYVVQLFGTPAAAPTAPIVEESVPEPVVLAQTEPVSGPGTDTPVEAVETPPVDTESDPAPTPSPTPPQATAGLEEAVVTDLQSDQSEVEVRTERTPATEARSEEVEDAAVPTDIPEEDRLVIEDTVVTEEGVSLYSGQITTSTGALPASIKPDESTTSLAGTTKTFSFLSIATKPQRILEILYFGIGTFVVIALILSIVIEIRRQQPLQIAYGIALLLLMYGLYTLHTSLTSGAVIV